MLNALTRLGKGDGPARGVRYAHKRFARARRFYRGVLVGIRALIWTQHPVLAHVIPMRRCNLSCAYCNEYDRVSTPVPLEAMRRRVDKLHELGTSYVVISGGEPLMHPGLEDLVAHTHRRGMIVGLLTNGYLLTEKRIRALNKAGLDYLQISIDNVKPDDVSMKSLKVLDRKLVLLSRFAVFAVNINSVIGGDIANPEDALVIARRATELGLATSLGIIHDGGGQLKPLNELEERVYRAVKKLGRRDYGPTDGFKDRLAKGMPTSWRCRAGARYLYVDEDGIVSYCSQQRGYPGISLERYTFEDIRREYYTKKECAPYCTVYCVHAVGVVDNWRNPQTREYRPGLASRARFSQPD